MIKNPDALERSKNKSIAKQILNSIVDLIDIKPPTDNSERINIEDDQRVKNNRG